MIIRPAPLSAALAAGTPTAGGAEFHCLLCFFIYVVLLSFLNKETHVLFIIS